MERGLPMLERKWLRLRHRLKCMVEGPQRPVAFLHIPKCGGTTVHRHFKSNFGGGRSGRLAFLDSMQADVRNPVAMANARSAQYVSGHCGWNALDALAINTFRFTFVRDPFERLQSLYLCARSRTETDHRVFAKLFAAAKQNDFPSFCLTDDLELRSLIDNAQTRAIAHDYYPYRPAEADVLRSALTHVEMLDFVADARDLDAVLPRLAALTETKLTSRREHLNRTDARKDGVMSRHEFESDRRLYALIAQDMEVYERVRSIAGGVRPHAIAA